MSLLESSNKEQLSAIMHEAGPQLIVAGAGTGKTRVITARIAYLITEKNINVDEILALTFTDKAAEEMEERVDKMLPYGYVDLWISTFHSFCDKLLKRHALDIGLSNNYKLINETEAWLLIKKNLARFDLDYYRPLGNPTKFIHALLKHFSRCKDEGISAEEYLEFADGLKLDLDVTDYVKKLDLPEDFAELKKEEKQALLKQEIIRINEIAKAYHTYQQILIENDCLDFGDLHNYAIKLFKDRPLILDKYRRQFKYILVDEFQDTNFVQYELIKLLAAPKNNLTVVGDDDQSIYKFRGASISNIMQFKEDYPNAQEVVLTENYRSAQEILDLSYNFIKQNDPNRLEAKLNINKKLKSNKTEQGVIDHKHFETIDAEAQFVISQIREIQKVTQCEWKQFAILVRANESANIFISYLDSANIPYQFLALRGLYTKPVIVDLLNYLKLLDDYHEGASVYRLLNFPCFKLKTDQIIKIVHYAKQKSFSLYDTLKKIVIIPGIEMETITQVGKIYAQVEADTALAQKKRPTEVLLNFLYTSGYLEHVKNLDEKIAKENLDYIQQFFQKVKEIETTYEDARIKDIVEVFDLELQSGEAGRLAFDVETGPDMVKVMTVHGSKGLEFDYVFLPNLVDRKFPTDERKEAIEIPAALIEEKLPEGNFHLEEERRLFYVAMTRARRGLFFTSAEDYGGVRKKRLSRFLIEMGYKKDYDIQSTETILIKPSKSSAVDKFVYELPKRFSFSQIATYEKCPLQYKYGNILKIPAFGSHYFTFGTIIHSTLQKFLEESYQVNNNVQEDLFSNIKKTIKKGTLPLDRLYQVYDDVWFDDWFQDPKQKEEYYKKGKALLKSFHADFNSELPEVRNLEISFKLPVGPYFFSGRIDRVDNLESGLVQIIDYKTGQAKDDKLTTDDKRQLLFYQIAAEEALKLKVEKMTYHYLEENKKISFMGKEKDKEELKKRFIEDIELIKAQKFEATPSPYVCGSCDYRNICEHKKL
ncbi:MAG: hypothetical protein UT32_C0009G0023 [Parcubacteria group bacterium GW2011_GWC2_39_14]|nr:MAG: hypothetical protein UT32_C0009G0023 [Parcubacteria group bacterium GW2011_GWC2_39_14]KKR55362.1 MAG: hypothetical protein UT91_C0002G0023 [Parcubacteria group bacterium GW2011_GWA2_40_23]